MSLFTAARFKTLGVQRFFTVLFLVILITAQPGFNQPVVKAANPSLVESIAAGRGLNVVGNSLPPVIDSAACTVSGAKCTQVLAHIRDDDCVTSAWVEVYPASGSPTDPVLIAVQKFHMTSSDQLAFTAANLSLAANVRVFVIAEDAQGNRSEPFQVSGPGKVKVFLPVMKK